MHNLNVLKPVRSTLGCFKTKATLKLLDIGLDNDFLEVIPKASTTKQKEISGIISS